MLHSPLAVQGRESLQRSQRLVDGAEQLPLEQAEGVSSESGEATGAGDGAATTGRIGSIEASE
jgi:hypothetical protein